MPEETMRSAIRREVQNRGLTRELAERVGRRRGWSGSLDHWVIRVDQMLAGARTMDVDCLVDAVAVTRSAACFAPATTALFVATVEALDQTERPGMARVARNEPLRDRRRA